MISTHLAICFHCFFVTFNHEIYVDYLMTKQKEDINSVECFLEFIYAISYLNVNPLRKVDMFDVDTRSTRSKESSVDYFI
jgi:hypothetical protein